MVGSVWANRYTPNLGWGEAEIVSAETPGARFYRLAVASNGSAIVVWTEPEGAVDSLFANRFTLEGGWATGEAIESSDVAVSRLPYVTIDPRGNALAFWTQSDNTRFALWANRFDANGWGTPEEIGDSAGDAFIPRGALAEGGNGLVVWIEVGAPGQLWVNHFE